MAGNTEMVYLKIEQNVMIREPSVTLKDIAKITCTNRPLVNKMKQMKVYNFHVPANQSKKKMQTEVFSVLKIIFTYLFASREACVEGRGLHPGELSPCIM